ncbi:MAG: 2-amino-4-hydroxy-6-hydroxymethyldihydropteridine diphosphokinase [Rhodospirillales bacterium RIFCSPLOWO2_12_FULL_67_15]|nr:MAG: 2-amino-4-hydroxy-6-hydroxymethyldihydropteridine diphosphokinase [Rhodospirillales bacterium RIFCSPLOWO2_12_FULL_67_15]
MILIGIGANIPSVFGTPRATCGAALAALGRAGVKVSACSSWWRSAPMPASDQPWFVNAVAGVETDLGPAKILALLLRIERAFGRTRTVANADRTLDLDLLDYRGQVSNGADGPSLPHPRMAGRAFVILPLLEIAPHWRHPVSGLSAERLAGSLPPGQAVLRMPPAQGLFGTEWEQESPLPELADERSG